MIVKFVVCCLVCVVGVSSAEDDGRKWVWKDNGRSGRADVGVDFSQSRGGASPRYEVFENEGPGPSSFGYRPEYQRPGRPTFGQGPAGFTGGPFNNRPGQGLFNPLSRPGGVYNQGNQGAFPPGGAYGQGGFISGSSYPQRPGVLTGPPWHREPPFKYFDSCKCSERFNCNTPGVSYGHCDVGKQYCCYSRKTGRPPGRPVHSPENGILVGPGGPADRPGSYPVGPQYPIGGDAYEGDNGILVGPGGPTGILGPSVQGPIGDRPVHSSANGVLVGPGGPFDGPGAFGYGRSAKKN